MRAVQPEGPYYLVAMCGGCQIAEQMILKLEAEDQEVGVFAIFDTWVYENVPRRSLWHLYTYQKRLQSLRGVSLRGKWQWFESALNNRIRSWTGKLKTVTPWEERYFPQDFKPPRFRAPIVLFKCPEQLFFYVNDPLFGWGERSESGVETHEINTKHHFVLREPHIRIIGDVLARHLRRSTQQVKLEALDVNQKSQVLQ
jgi:thioesterase domain-containing protein